MRAYERLLNYVKIHTTSDEDSDTVPSTARQLDLSRLLCDELKELGIEDAKYLDNAYVYGHLPASEGCENAPCIGLIAHIDTAPDASGENVKPQIIKDYDGSDIVLKNGRVISADVFTHLKGLVGRTLITTDGTTLLGADDKAGIAEIMTAVERILAEDIPHGPISIAFTPDEEIGHGASELDLAYFGAKYAYTIDGGAENELEYENFNAAQARFTIVGKSVHPGDAKNKMVNAALVACEINTMLPAFETPEHTEGREGFYHITDISGQVENASISYIVRDHSDSVYEARLDTLRHIEKLMNEKYGDGTVTLEIKEQYRNMIEQIRPHIHLIENAKAACVDAHLTPVEIPIRGGTDGALLSYRGLPCPNIGTGGYAFHGPYEHISIEGMDSVVEIILGILKRYASL